MISKQSHYINGNFEAQSISYEPLELTSGLITCI